jgi:hypothetical protein
VAHVAKSNGRFFAVQFPLWVHAALAGWLTRTHKQDCSSRQSLHLLFGANMQSKQTSGRQGVRIAAFTQTKLMAGHFHSAKGERPRASFPFFLSAKLWARAYKETGGSARATRISCLSLLEMCLREWEREKLRWNMENLHLSASLTVSFPAEESFKVLTFPLSMHARRLKKQLERMHTELLAWCVFAEGGIYKSLPDKSTSAAASLLLLSFRAAWSGAAKNGIATGAHTYRQRTMYITHTQLLWCQGVREEKRGMKHAVALARQKLERSISIVFIALWESNEWETLLLAIYSTDSAKAIW